MNPTLARWIPRLMPVVLAVLLIAGSTRPASARPCFTSLGNCWVDSARISSFFFRWAAGLDCELGFVSCARFDLIGY